MIAKTINHTFKDVLNPSSQSVKEKSQLDVYKW